MTTIWTDPSTVRKEAEANAIELNGGKDVARSMRQWLGLSPFANEKKRLSA